MKKKALRLNQFLSFALLLLVLCVPSLAEGWQDSQGRTWTDLPSATMSDIIRDNQDRDRLLDNMPRDSLKDTKPGKPARAAIDKEEAAKIEAERAEWEAERAEMKMEAQKEEELLLWQELRKLELVRPLLRSKTLIVRADSIIARIKRRLAEIGP
jgi:hypothetical protein